LVAFFDFPDNNDAISNQHANGLDTMHRIQRRNDLHVAVPFGRPFKNV